MNELEWQQNGEWEIRNEKWDVLRCTHVDWWFFKWWNFENFDVVLLLFGLFFWFYLVFYNYYYCEWMNELQTMWKINTHTHTHLKHHFSLNSMSMVRWTGNKETEKREREREKCFI